MLLSNALLYLSAFTSVALSTATSGTKLEDDFGLTYYSPKMQYINEMDSTVKGLDRKVKQKKVKDQVFYTLSTMMEFSKNAVEVLDTNAKVVQVAKEGFIRMAHYATKSDLKDKRPNTMALLLVDKEAWMAASVRGGSVTKEDFSFGYGYVKAEDNLRKCLNSCSDREIKHGYLGSCAECALVYQYESYHKTELKSLPQGKAKFVAVQDTRYNGVPFPADYNGDSIRIQDPCDHSKKGKIGCSNLIPAIGGIAIESKDVDKKDYAKTDDGMKALNDKAHGKTTHPEKARMADQLVPQAEKEKIKKSNKEIVDKAKKDQEEKKEKDAKANGGKKGTKRAIEFKV